MKLRYLVILSGFWILTACGDNNAKNYLDERKYSVEDEYTYSVLLYDYHNSLILSLLGVENDNPDQAAQIEEIRKRDSYKVGDAELRAALLTGTMDMPTVKEKTVAELRKRQMSLLNEHLDLESVQSIMKHYVEELDAAKAKLKAGNLYIEDALIDYYIFNPHINYDTFDDGLPSLLVNTASSIAVTRFNHLKWHKKISDCLLKKISNKPSGTVSEKIILCAEGYTRAVSEEAAKISRQLLPFRHHFEISYPVPDKSKMVKEVSSDGQSYIWRPKN